MPSNTASGPKLRSIKPGNDFLRGTRYREVPDFILTHSFAAADLNGADSGFFVVPGLPGDAVFLGGNILWATAGTNDLRVKKVLAAVTDAAGTAADANNVNISEFVDLTETANVAFELWPLTTGFANRLEEGDKVAIASDLGTASLAGAVVILRFAFI